ncbi:MAG TPA: efflux RND transporter periplasmic adaptor subunit [Candidatus Deferrimicrobium sp.]|nr:efflux RND transporter periplasmic adaptor subunit [Candidatus Deferrimicrobium sp.]
MNRAMTWLAAGLLLTVGIGAVYMSTVGSADTQAATGSYLTQAAQRGDVTMSSAATGTVAAAATYSLAFGTDARLADTITTGSSTQQWTVDEVHVSVGDRVVAGQVLATADTSDLEDQVAETDMSLSSARITLREAESDLADARSRAQQDLVDATSAVASARLSVKSARAQRNAAADGTPTLQARIALIGARDQLRAARQQREDIAARLDGDFPDETIAVSQAQATVLDLESQLADLTGQLEHAELVAPLDGVISDVNITAGLLAPSSDAILVDSATLEVVADVVESDVSSVEVGQPAVVSIDALDTEVAGTVTSVSPTTTGDGSSVVTFPVTVTLSDPGEAVRSGMSSDVQITLAEAADAVTVPTVALVGSDAQYMVRVVATDGSVEMRAVTVGLVSETLAEVQSGLAEGEAVILGSDSDRAGTADEVTDFVAPGGFEGLGGLSGGAPPQGFRQRDQ